MMSDRWKPLRSLFGGQPTRTASGSLDGPYPAPAQQVHQPRSDASTPAQARMRFSNLAKRGRLRYFQQKCVLAGQAAVAVWYSRQRSCQACSRLRISARNSRNCNRHEAMRRNCTCVPPPEQSTCLWPGWATLAIAAVCTATAVEMHDMPCS